MSDCIDTAKILRYTLSHSTMILDANALTDFHWLDEWMWFQKNYSPLCASQEVFNCDQLTKATKESAERYLQPLGFDTEEIYANYKQIRKNFAPINSADSSTLAISKHHMSICVTDAPKMISICEKYGILHTNTLYLLSDMVHKQYKTASQVITKVDLLTTKRGKWIKPEILELWKRNIQQYHSN
jgi:hypothetical protein